MAATDKVGVREKHIGHQNTSAQLEEPDSTGLSQRASGRGIHLTHSLKGLPTPGQSQRRSPGLPTLFTCVKETLGPEELLLPAVRSSQEPLALLTDVMPHLMRWRDAVTQHGGQPQRSTKADGAAGQGILL